MLARCVFTVWGAWLGALGLAAALTAWGIWNLNPVFPLGLSAVMLAGGLGLVITATVRLIRGPRAAGPWRPCSWGRRRSGSWPGTS